MKTNPMKAPKKSGKRIHVHPVYGHVWKIKSPLATKDFLLSEQEVSRLQNPIHFAYFQIQNIIFFHDLMRLM